MLTRSLFSGIGAGVVEEVPWSSLGTARMARTPSNITPLNKVEFCLEFCTIS